MRKYLLLSSIIIIYYITTFIISFSLIAKSLDKNEPFLFSEYINSESLKFFFFNDTYDFGLSLINIIDKNIMIKSESIEFSGELSSAFLEKLFTRMSSNVSKDFSNPEIMLYFYFNSNEITTYLNQSIKNFGDYNFEKYLLEKKPQNIKEAQSSNFKKTENNITKLIKRIKSRIKSVDYFFLISPIHFKIDVIHQEIPFIVILKFNGYKWKLHRLKIPYNELIDSKNINLNN